MISEAGIIDVLRSLFPKYIGDDVAIIPYQSNKKYIITKDILIEDVHFRTSYFSSLDLAHKALEVNLSDIAAMSGNPLFILLGIAIPTHLSEYAENFIKHFATCCIKSSLALIGGDTTKSPDRLMISVTAIGSIQINHIKYLNTAKVGDLVCVAGNLGYAHIGLQLLEAKQQSSDYQIFKEALLKPKALIKEGMWLGKQTAVTAMTDISDGLFINLQKLCKLSSCGAEINFNALPISHDFLKACQSLDLEPIDVILKGGEDYGLLFTINEYQYVHISKKFKQRFGYCFQYIGRVISDNELVFIENGSVREKIIKPFSHFGE